ncbi:MAG: nuclease-related domain-containing protein [Gemmatimonadaceae bacterium]
MALTDGPFRLPRSEYHHFYNIVIPSRQGTTEVDHLIVSRFGVFVVELKDRSGWIFGNAEDAFWTSMHFGQRHRFQNPLHQNYGHLKALEELLALDRRVLHGIVVFRGSFRFKTTVPAGVRLYRYRAWIATHRKAVLTAAQVESLLQALRTRTQQGWLAGIKHARAVERRFSSDSTCPKCGGDLLRRTQKQGPRPGSVNRPGFAGGSTS